MQWKIISYLLAIIGYVLKVNVDPDKLSLLSKIALVSQYIVVFIIVTQFDIVLYFINLVVRYDIRMVTCYKKLWHIIINCDVGRYSASRLMQYKMHLDCGEYVRVIVLARESDFRPVNRSDNS